MKDTFAPEFILIPREAYQKEGLTLSDGMVYGVIYWYYGLKEGRCFASNGSIGKILKIGVQKVSEAISKLEKIGLVEVLYTDESKKTRLEIVPLVSWGLRHTAKGVTPHGDRGVTPHGVQRENNTTENNYSPTANAVENPLEKILSKGASYKKSKYHPACTTLFRAFEVVDPKNSTYYGKTGQLAAATFIINQYGLEEVLKTVNVLSVTNTLPFFPRIYSPYDLKENWQKLHDSFARKKHERAGKSRKVANRYNTPA